MDYHENIDYLERELITNENIKFKLNAYCINLKDKIVNMKFIQDEWNDYLNIYRFEALETCTKSHNQLLSDIWNNRDTELFPIVIIEDDVFRRGNFNKYWNKLLEIDNCDYIPFDAFYLKIRPNQTGCPEDFVSLLEHRATGFTVFYKSFFERFKTLEELQSVLTGDIDMNFTHNEKFINYTPRTQVCRQIVSKPSMTVKDNLITNWYLDFYELAESILENLIVYNSVKE